MLNWVMHDKVEINTRIGIVGSIGASLSSHLQHEVLRHGKRVSPKNYL